MKKASGAPAKADLDADRRAEPVALNNYLGVPDPLDSFGYDPLMVREFIERRDESP